MSTEANPVTAFLAKARKRWATANDAEAENRAEGYEDLRFLNLDQWPDRIKQLRLTPGRERPCLTIDQIGEPYRQLTNKQRESRPAIHINPEDGQANNDTAEVLQGIVRAVEYDSDAQIAYATAFEGAVGIGWGYARLRSDFEGDGPDQQLIVDMIENPFAVYLDPGTRLWDRRDMRFGFIVQDLLRDQYIDLYGETAVGKAGASLTDFSGLGDEAKDWFPEGSVRIAEYYYLQDTTVRLGEDATGKTVDATKDNEKTLKNVREITRPSVYWCKINGLEILDGNADKTAGRRVPGKTIPIRPCYGQVLNVNGKRVYRGIVRAARDPQQAYNYQNSALVEELALVPKSKVIMAEGQDEDHEAQWQTANTENYPYLTYKPTTVGDKLVEGPRVVQFTDPTKIQAITVAINQSKADLRSTTGWYDATDPSRRNADQSGRAILARKESQNESHSNYHDNFNRFLTSFAKVMLEWIPEIYDRPGRIVRVLGMEDEVERVMVNQPHVDKGDGQLQPIYDEAAAKLIKDIQHFDLSKGTYGVRVSPGTSYTTRKQEAAEYQFRLLEARPELMQVFGDIAFKNLDGPGHEQIAERIARTIPPQIKGPEQGQPELPPEVQQQMAQAKQAMEAMHAKIGEQQQVIDTDSVKMHGQLQIKQIDANVKLEELRFEAAKLQESSREHRIDNDTKIRVAQIQAESAAIKVRADLMIAQVGINAEMAAVNIQSETQRLLKLADLQVSATDAAAAELEPDADDGSVM